MYRNSEIFLTSFNRIDKRLKSFLTKKKDVGFTRAVKILRNSNAVVKRYSNDLLEFAELRNAIVHNKIDTDYAIAEPHDSIVKKIVMIEEELTEPKKVAAQFYRKVETFQINDTLEQMLEKINEKGFTKFPLYDGPNFRGLITEKGISMWFAENSEKNPKEVLLKEVLTYEQEGNYKFISAETTVLEAVDIYKGKVGNGTRLQALLITKSGYPSKDLLGIITSLDMMKI